MLTKVTKYVRWSFKYAKDFDYLLKQHEKKSKTDPNWKTPSAIKDQVELEEWELQYVKDFYTLTSSRQAGMGVGAVPVSEILLFADKLKLSAIEDFLFIMQSMDNAYLDEYNKKQAAENPKK